ncbi:hypothetical protein [Streptomyces sp. GESEQ-35]|uniref:hypothetical protein n=1 Tax=Streptomyces sp. GESEQ-35 TaxID=2812657 RepID=UPI001B31BEE5|nr:hypothetical protein [Streptomyces sp. GESEQ-35]
MAYELDVVAGAERHRADDVFGHGGALARLFVGEESVDAGRRGRPADDRFANQGVTVNAEETTLTVMP